MLGNFQFNLHLVSADLNSNLNQRELDNVRSSPITYLVSPNNEQVMLCSNERYPVASFSLQALPPFLESANGIYLGEFYTPMLNLNGQSYYLRNMDRPNVYELIQPEQVQLPEELFSFAVLSQNLNWAEEDLLENIVFENFTPDESVIGFFLEDSQGTTPNRQLVYSPTACPGDCTTCGDVCPENYFCRENFCQTDLLGVGFGIRGNGVVYTYKISPDGESLMVAAVEDSLISANLETNNLVRERFFFTDYSVDENNFVTGQEYPMYIWQNLQKRYLSNPNRINENGPTMYQLTDQPSLDGARFSPMVTTNWREMNLTPGDFVNFAFNDTPRLALWNTLQFNNLPAVVEPNLSFAAPPPFTPPFAAPVTAGPVMNLATMAPPLPAAAVVASPFWTQWWFWLVISVVLILLIVLILFLSSGSSPKVPVVVAETPVVKVEPYPEPIILT